jgi:hypothetical protein
MVTLPRWLVAEYAKREKPVETLVLAKAIPAINLRAALVMAKNYAVKN